MGKIPDYHHKASSPIRFCQNQSDLLLRISQIPRQFGLRFGHKASFVI